MKKILALGEILLRLSPPNYQTLTQSRNLDCQFGGSEFNVLSTLARLGYPVSMVTALPDNDLGEMAEHFLFAHRIGQDFILKREGRLGTYYYQKGFSVRASRVIYDRKFSVFYESTLADYDLEAAFEETAWFHVSGITAALNKEMYDLTLAAMQLAKKKEIPISFDLNYRQSLWNSFEEARVLLAPLLALADVCIGLEPIQLLGEHGFDTKDELGLQPPYHDRQILVDVLEKIKEQYHLQTIAFTQREMSYNNEYLLKAYLYKGGSLYETANEPIQVLDRVGTGDAFTAGLIYGLLEKEVPDKILNLAMAHFKFKHTIEGDINIMIKNDIVQMLSNDSHEIKR